MARTLESLPNDIIDEIYLRLHKLNIQEILPQLKDPFRKLLTFACIDDWIDNIQDHVRIECLLSNGSKVLYQHHSFTEEVKTVIYSNQDCSIGQIRHGYWYIYCSNMFEDYVMIMNDKELFLDNLPQNVKKELEL